MIINIRGTSGAGKSHLVRSIMELYNEQVPSYMEGRKRPLYYTCLKELYIPLLVPGHYETPTGGCDTISRPDDVYTLVKSGIDKGYNVLFEGIMIGDDVRRCVEMKKLTEVIVIALNTPIDQCLAGIQSRRDTRGDDRELNPKNTISRADRLRKSMMPRLKDAGIQTFWLNREEAFNKVKELLLYEISL